MFPVVACVEGKMISNLVLFAYKPEFRLNFLVTITIQNDETLTMNIWSMGVSETKMNGQDKQIERTFNAV